MWGGVIIHVPPGRRCFHHIEMFSVVKLKKSFWFAAGCAGYYVAFMHFLTRVGKYNDICSESFSNSFQCCHFRVGIGGCCFLVLPLFLAHFLDVPIYRCCLMNRDIWWRIFTRR